MFFNGMKFFYLLVVKHFLVCWLVNGRLYLLFYLLECIVALLLGDAALSSLRARLRPYLLNPEKEKSPGNQGP